MEDIAAERACIAGIIQHGKEAYLDCSDILHDYTFTEQVNIVLYDIVSTIYKKELNTKIDLALISSTAKEIGLYKSVENETKYIAALFNYYVELSNIRGYAQKIRKLYEFRKLLSVVDETATIIKSFNGSETITEAIGEAEKPIFEFANNLTSTGKTIKHIGEGLEEYVKNLYSGPIEFMGLQLGLPKLQKALGGIEGGIHVITARPGVGKSTLGVGMGLYSGAKEFISTLYLDTEMDLETGQWNRMLSRISGVEFNAIRYRNLIDKDFLKIEKAKRILLASKLDYMNVSGNTFDEVLSHLRRWCHQKVGYDEKGNINKGLIIYDYLKLTDYNQLKSMREYEIIGMRMSLLHDFSLKYKIPIIVFAQQNKEHDTSQSDRILWFATSLSALHKKTNDEMIADGPQYGNIRLNVDKARWGGGLIDGDYLNLRLDGKVSTIVETKTWKEIEQEKSFSKAEEICLELDTASKN